MNRKYKWLVYVTMVLAVALGSINANTKRWNPTTLDVERIEVAPNVYAVVDTLSDDWLKEGASAYTSAGFIVGEKGVFVVESYVNARLAGQLIALIKEVTNKPILYVTSTSYHGDHMYGNYLFPNATIIQHEKSKKYFEQKLDGDLTFMKNMFGHPEGHDSMDEIAPRTGDILINDGVEYIRVDLGDRIVEVRQFGLGQTRGDLQGWVPDAKVFWAGNAIIGPKPLVPWLTEGGHKKSLDALVAMKKFLPEDATIVSGHSIPFKNNAANSGLDYSIAYLSALHKTVEKAVKKKMGLMDTVDYAALDDFSAYDLFNWNHKQMNVPCAYRYHMLKKGRTIPEEEAPMMMHCNNGPGDK
jgi:glyoxylase-like metal-dependent hydrolase (beta-lactamase superfamily II)